VPAPRPAGEPDRLAALRRYDVLDTPPEPAFDDLARLAAHVCGAPMALVSLVDDTRQWCKAELAFGRREVPRDASFCAHSILGPDVLVVPDATRDPRFAGSPLVTGPPGVRFYAGAPLVTPDGYALGTLAVLDRTPRDLPAEQRALLEALARRAVAELELRRSLHAQGAERAFVRRVLDTQPSMVFVKDWEGRFVLVNEALARTYGTTVEGIVGKTDADFNPDAGEVEHFMRDDREVIASRRPKLIAEEPVTHSDGQVRWYSTVKVPLVEDDGRCDKLLGVATDISVQRRALVALAESERLHRTLGDVAPGFVWTVDAAGRYEYVNRTWLEFTGSTLEELNAGGGDRFNHPDEVEEVRRRWARAAESGTPFEMELRYRRQDGAYRWMLCRVVPVRDEAGRVSRWVGSAVDIHELKRVEEERRRTDERLRQVERLEALGRLAGGVAHDLNNMLVAILGYSEFVAKSLPSDDERRADVESIAEAAGRSAQLTRQLLAFARRDMVEPRRVDLNAVVRGAERMLRLSAGEGVEVELVLEEGELCTLADPTRLERVLLNLVLNARDAMATGGRLRIATGRTTLDEGLADRHGDPGLAPGAYVCLTVTDTGHGMDRATLAQVFEPFFTTKPFGQGTGLGLSTAYGSVKQAGGHITVQSEPGRGTTFTVYLPAAGDRPAAEAARGIAAPSGDGRTILVVDDDAPVRSTTARSLVHGGYRALTAASAAEALELLAKEEKRVDLVLTDVVMPGMGGRELAARIAERYPGMPVVLMSGYTEEEIRLGGPPNGGPPFLAKPFTPQVLVAKMREVLERGTTPSAPR